MATLWIREYSLAQWLRGRKADGESGAVAMPVAAEPGTDQSPVTYSTSTQSAAFGADTAVIAITSSAAFHYVVAKSPTATTNALRIPADVIHYVGVNSGDKVAAIAAA